MTTVHVLLAHGHALVRAAMAALLRGLGHVDVVAEAGDGYEALKLIAEKKPDIALIDICMPGLSGLEVTVRAAKEHPFTRAIILSMYADHESVNEALLAPAAGYLSKTSDRAELESALRAVARGDMWLTPTVSNKVIAAFRQRLPRATAAGSFEVLTPRQREVLHLLVEGLSNKEIAARLDLGVKTVETHRSELMERLGIHNIAGLVRYAIRVGLIHAET